MSGCFRFNRDLDDLRLEWDAYIDSTSSEETATFFEQLQPKDVMERVPHWGAGIDDRVRLINGYRDAPPQPLLASRGSYLGQLKLSVYVNCGLLTCHVIQARHLASKHNHSCDAYIKISLVPDESMRTRCKTEAVLDTNSPLFDEKFSFELIDEDMKKRLYISVWNKIPGKECKDEFLGCMSFGIRHIQTDRRAISGWYYLLHEDVGRRKHLQAMVKKQHLKEQTTNNAIPKVNQDILWMDPYTITVPKGKNGYGFTVSGFSPVLICRIEKGSPADKAGLQKDDCIVRIDGLNVSRSTSDSVAKLIRNTSKQLTLEIQRSQVLATVDMAPSSIKPWNVVSSTPMAGTVPPAPSLPFAPIPSQPPLPRPAAPPPAALPHPAMRPSGPPQLERWNMEIESKDPVYGNCGVFGESDPLYSTITVGSSSASRPPGHSSASSSGSSDPAYGMIRVMPPSRQPLTVVPAVSKPSARDDSSIGSGSGSGRNRNSSAGCSADLPYTVCTLPRSRSSVAAPLTAHAAYLNGQYVAFQFPKSFSSGAVNDHYRLCHDPEGIYGSSASSGGGTVTSGHARDCCAQQQYGVYARGPSHGSVRSAGSANSTESGSAGGSRTLPRQKKKVHFKEFG